MTSGRWVLLLWALVVALTLLAHCSEAGPMQDATRTELAEEQRAEAAEAGAYARMPGELSDLEYEMAKPTTRCREVRPGAVVCRYAQSKTPFWRNPVTTGE